LPGCQIFFSWEVFEGADYKISAVPGQALNGVNVYQGLGAVEDANKLAWVRYFDGQDDVKTAVSVSGGRVNG